MKTFVLLASLLWAAPSIAATRVFSCDALKDPSGNALSLGGGYNVLDPSDVSYQLPSSVTLQFVASGHGPDFEFSMQPSDHNDLPMGQLFVSDQTDVQVIYAIAPAMPGLPAESIEVRKFAGTVEYRGACHFQRLQP